MSASPDRAIAARRCVTILFAVCLALAGLAPPDPSSVLAGPLASPCATGPPSGSEAAGGWISVAPVVEGSGHTVTRVRGHVCFGGPMRPPIEGDWSVTVWAEPGTATATGGPWGGKRDYRFPGGSDGLNLIIRSGDRRLAFSFTVQGDDVPERDERFRIEAIGFMGYLEIPMEGATVTILDDDRPATTAGPAASPATAPSPSVTTPTPSPVAGSSPTPTPTPGRSAGPSSSPGPDLPRLVVDDVAVLEGANGWGIAWLPFRLDRPLATDLPIRYQVIPGTPPATWRTDYALGLRDNAPSVTALAIVPAGETRIRVHLTIVGDTTPEADERVLFHVLEAPGVILERPEATLTIVDDDARACSDDASCAPAAPSPAPAPDAVVSVRCDRPPFGLASPARRVEEPATGMTIIRCSVTVTPVHLPPWAGVGHALSVRIRATGVTATVGADVTALDRRLAFAPYQKVAAAELAILADALDEQAETLVVELLDPVDVVVGESRGTAGLPRLVIEILPPGSSVGPRDPIPDEPDRVPGPPKG